MPPTTPRMIRAAIVLYQEPDAFLQMQIVGCRTVRLSSLSVAFQPFHSCLCWMVLDLENARWLFAHARPRHQLNLACLCIWILPSLTRQGKCLKKACFDSSTNNWEPVNKIRQKIFVSRLASMRLFRSQAAWLSKQRLCPFTLAATTL